MMVEAAPLAPPDPLEQPPGPLEPPCEKPEKPAFCEVGFNSARPCFSEAAEVQWNGAVGYWYCVFLIVVVGRRIGVRLPLSVHSELGSIFCCISGCRPVELDSLTP